MAKLSAMQQILLVVGTQKGMFFCVSNRTRQVWQPVGAVLSGWTIDCEAALVTPSGPDSRLRLLAGTSHLAYASTIRACDGVKGTWEQILAGPQYSKVDGRRLRRVLCLAAAGRAADTIYAGVEDAGLFVSRDGGSTWQEVSALIPLLNQGKPEVTKHAVSSVSVDPVERQRLWVAVSGSDVLRSPDGGKTWSTCEAGLPAGSRARQLVQNPREPGHLLLLSTGGIFRSCNGGEAWRPLPFGLPGTWPAALAVSSRGDVYTVPLTSRAETYPKHGRLRVYCLRSGADFWECTDRGLPGEPYYVGVQPNALITDDLDPPGVYLGTTSGEVFCSPGVGETWLRLPGQFPPVTSLLALPIGE